jgi:protein-arginine kinase activator protein McsA
MNERRIAIHEAHIDYHTAETKLRQAAHAGDVAAMDAAHEALRTATTKLTDANARPDIYVCHYCPREKQHHSFADGSVVTITIASVAWPVACENEQGEPATRLVSHQFHETERPVLHVCGHCANKRSLIPSLIT